MALALGATTAAATVVQSGNLRVTVLSQVLPFKLPRHTPAPIAVFVSGHIAAVDHTTPPQLQRMTIKLNRHGLLQARGLPTCRIPQVEASSTQRALARCAPALIGSGQFWAHIVIEGQAPYPTRGRLLIFNGNERICGSPHRLSTRSRRRGWPSSSRTQGGGQGERTQVRDPRAADRGHRDAPCHTRRLLLAAIYAVNPFSTSFVIPFRISHIDQGPYGTELRASFPQALGNWGFVDRIKLTLRRKYRFQGRQLSHFNAACPAPAGTMTTTFPLALVNFYFKGAQHMQAGVSKACRVVR